LPRNRTPNCRQTIPEKQSARDESPLSVSAPRGLSEIGSPSVVTNTPTGKPVCLQPRKTTKEVEQLLCEAREILVDVDLFMPKIPKDRATPLHARLEAFQDERRHTRWASVRIIHNRNLFFIERGLGLYLWHRNSPSQAYQVAASYSEHYDPRYGNGLSGPSAKRIQEIADFTLAVQIHESDGTSA
jgi:hypothetical protein